MKLSNYFAGLILLCLANGCAIHKDTFIGEQWERHTSPKASGFNVQKLEEVTDYINRNSNTTGLIVIKNGKVAYEYGDLKKISYIASCRKSVLSMLYGKYVDDGTINLGTSIGELGINEKDGLLPIELTATVDHIINSRSGVHHIASNGGYDKANFQPRGSMQPGDFWVYNNWDFNVAGYIFEQYAGKSIYQEMEAQFAKPLGFQDWNIENQKKSGQRSKSQYPAYHMYLSTRDMAKLGQLMLNKGKWNGQQLISKEWVKKITTTVTPHETLVERYGPADPDGIHMSYGYMWWLFDSYKGKLEYEDAFSAIGYGGQYITVFPKLDMVIAHKTKLGLLEFMGLKKDGDAHYWDIVHKIIDARF